MPNPKKFNRRYRGGLKRPLDNHFRTNAGEYEYVARKTFAEDQTISEGTRVRWFKPGWEAERDQLRKEQRAQGLPDSMFQHPQAKKKRAA